MTLLDAPARRGPDAREAALRLACVGLALVAMLPGLQLLSWIWSRSEYLGHGYAIPAASALLIYLRRDEVWAALRAGPVPRTGPLWVALAVVLESGAVAAEVSSLAGVGLPIMLAATAFAVGGAPLLRVLAVPLALLLLMVPPPGFVQDRLLIELKSLVMHTAVLLLQALGYTITGVGNRILVPGHELFVANACSGLTSIVTLSPLAVLIAYFLGHGVWRRIAIVASLVPLAVLGNIVRVVLTVILVSGYGIEMAEGALHESFGVVTFALGTLLLIGVARMLERW